MKYSFLDHSRVSFNNYSLIPIRKKDIYLIIKWRNEQMDVLRQNKKLTKKNQLNYYHNHILPSFFQKKPKIILFSYLFNDSCIGYGGLTNINWNSKRAEISFLLDTKRAQDKKLYSQEFGGFLKMIKKIAFEKLKLDVLFTETFDIRPLHVKILENNDFKLKNVIKKRIFIEGKFVNSLIHECLQ